MRLPLIILSAGALLAGLIPFSHFVTADGHPFDSHLHIGFSVLPVLLGAGGIALAYYLYHRQNDRPEKIMSSLGGLYQLVNRKFYIDELYRFITVRIIFNGIGRPAAWIDKHIIDGIMNAIASVTASIARAIKGIQSGKVQQYALYFFAGILGLAILFIYILK
jgi:NADH-quinone oxidoreductase subunit L